MAISTKSRMTSVWPGTRRTLKCGEDGAGFSRKIWHGQRNASQGRRDSHWTSRSICSGLDIGPQKRTKRRSPAARACCVVCNGVGVARNREADLRHPWSVVRARFPTQRRARGGRERGVFGLLLAAQKKKKTLARRLFTTPQRAQCEGNVAAHWEKHKAAGINAPAPLRSPK